MHLILGSIMLRFLHFNLETAPCFAAILATLIQCSGRGIRLTQSRQNLLARRLAQLQCRLPVFSCRG